MVKFLLIYLSILGAAVFVKSQDAIVQWIFGELNGVTDTVNFDGNNYELHKYLGIPFAKPPVGELRFRKTEPVEYMDSPFHANESSMACVQFDVNINFSQSRTFSSQSEDCLYLNVYVPTRQADSKSGHAVAIWIHGGGFIGGASSSYNATYLSVYGNVIVVTINYRLGLYGFLSTEDDNAPGNYAFWDQHMAFKWVHDNIGFFGGDNQRVTIFGESAGAISVSHQGLITQNKGLFQRIIAQSGSALDPASPKLDLNALEDAQNFGKIFGCDITYTELLMDCLRSKSNDDIINAMMNNGIMAMNFDHVVDNVLIKRDVTTIPSIMDKQQLDEVEFYRSLDVMNGFNSHEGFLIAEFFVTDGPKDLLMSREQMKAMLGPILGVFLGHPVDESVIEVIMAEYTNWTSPDSHEEVRLQLIKLFGDLLYGGPAIETALLHTFSTWRAKNYVYRFVANPPFGELETPEWVPGANHADDLAFIFGIQGYMPYIDPVTTWDLPLSRKIVRYWSNFMKSGDPNYPDKVSPVWPQYDMASQSYLKLEEYTTNTSVGHFCYAKENNFWYNVIPEINMAMDKMSKGSSDCVSTARKCLPSKLLALLMSVLCILSML